MKGEDYKANKINAFISRSPFSDEYAFDSNVNSLKGDIDDFIKKNNCEKTVVIQGLGFVGSAMLTAVSSAKDEQGRTKYAVIGIDLPTPESYWKVGRINAGQLPVISSDENFKKVFEMGFKNGNIMATTNTYAYEVADIIVIDINLDVKKKGLGNARESILDFEPFMSAMRVVAQRMKPSCLIVVETTVPPGTCEKILLPIIESEFKKRNLMDTDIKLAHSYERVMPGENYLRSITSFYRAYSGINEISKKEAKEFLDSFIDTKNYPLTELSTTTASEMGKVLENAYRAANIAFIREWTEFAEIAGINLFDVIQAIRKRETHKNIMLPGFGVGGYCLPKDPLLANWSLSNLFNGSRELDMSVEAVNINDFMPYHSFSLLIKQMGDIKGKKLLLMGVSYLSNVTDTRYSPTETFYKKCVKSGALVYLHDPIVSYWLELNLNVERDIDNLRNKEMDAIILAVRHDEYYNLTPDDFKDCLKPNGLILDCNNLIDDEKAEQLRRLNFQLIGVGKGHWNTINKRIYKHE